MPGAVAPFVGLAFAFVALALAPQPAFAGENRCFRLLRGALEALVEVTTPRPTAGEASDPYYTGARQAAATDGTLPPQPRVPDGYTYLRGDDLGPGIDRRELPMQVTVPDPNVWSSESRLVPEMSPGEVVQLNTTRAGRGATSVVYYHHPELPLELRSLAYSNAQRLAWVRAHAHEVIKVRLARAFDTQSGHLTALEALRTDLLVYQRARQLAGRARYRGETLVEVARILSTRAEHERGILRQEVVSGPTVYELQQALSCLRRTVFCTAREHAERQALLDEVGFGKNPHDFAELQDRIWALEQFYRDSHANAFGFRRKHRLVELLNEVEPRRGEPVGLDYQHGRNVVWSKERGRFVMVDW